MAIRSSAEVNVGNISIRCGGNGGIVPRNYQDVKETTSFFDISHSSYGNTFIGEFYSTGINSPPDNIKINLSSLSNPSGKYLKLQLLSQVLYSNLKLTINVTRGTTNLGNFSTNPFASGVNDNLPLFDIRTHIPLSSSPSENIFEIKVTAYTPTQLYSGTLESFFPASSSFIDNNRFYLFNYHILDANLNPYKWKTVTISDNTQCYEGPTTTWVTPNVSSSASTNSGGGTSSGSNSLFGLSCGSIALKNKDNKKGNLYSVAFTLIGLSIPLLVGTRRRKKRLTL